MTASTMALMMFGTLFGALILRVPVAFALGFACLPPLVMDDRLNLTVLLSQMFSAFNSFLLLAVPFSFWPPT